MKLILIHGSNVVASLNKLKQISHLFDPMSFTRLNSKELDKATFLDQINGVGLFSSERLIVVDNLEVSNLPEKLPESPDLTLVLFFDKELSATNAVLKFVKEQKGEVWVFSEVADKSIFKYLDALELKNKQAYVLLDKLLVDFGDQYLLTMIIYMLRRNIVGSKSIFSRAKNLSFNEVKNFYRLVLETDYKIKSGLLEGKMGLFLITREILGRS